MRIKMPIAIHGAPNRMASSRLFWKPPRNNHIAKSHMPAKINNNPVTIPAYAIILGGITFGHELTLPNAIKFEIINF